MKRMQETPGLGQTGIAYKEFKMTKLCTRTLTAQAMQNDFQNLVSRSLQ